MQTVPLSSLLCNRPYEFIFDCMYAYLEGKHLNSQAVSYFPSSAEVKNVWNYKSTPAICLLDVMLN